MSQVSTSRKIRVHTQQTEKWDGKCIGETGDGYLSAISIVCLCLYHFTFAASDFIVQYLIKYFFFIFALTKQVEWNNARKAPFFCFYTRCTPLYANIFLVVIFVIVIVLPPRGCRCALNRYAFAYSKLDTMSRLFPCTGNHTRVNHLFSLARKTKVHSFAVGCWLYVPCSSRCCSCTAIEIQRKEFRDKSNRMATEIWRCRNRNWILLSGKCVREHDKCTNDSRGLNIELIFIYQRNCVSLIDYLPYFPAIFLLRDFWFAYAMWVNEEFDPVSMR